MRTTLDTRLERLLYGLALRYPNLLDAVEDHQTSRLLHSVTYSVTAGLRAQALAAELAQEHIAVMASGEDSSA